MRLSIILILLISALWTGCKNNLDTDTTLRFGAEIVVTDTSFVTRTIGKTSRVSNAEVVLEAVSFDYSSTSVTNDSGVAEFPNLIPDYYNCRVSKTYPEDSVKKYLPLTQEINLVGSQANVPLMQDGDLMLIGLKPVLKSNIVISEIYYNGAPPQPPYYFHDQFTEIYNNSSETVYLDSYAVGNVDYGYRESDPDFLHCVHLYGFPGSGTDYPLEPGQMIIIAQDAIDHTEFNKNSIDLTSADFEYYNPLSNDVDVAEVPNMIQMHHKYGIDFLYSVMNDAIVLFKLEAQDSVWNYDEFNRILVPTQRAIDGVEYRESLIEYELKHLPDEVDAGLTGGTPAYKGRSIARKIFKEISGQIILMDNNNSSIDFQVLDTPTPGIIE